MKHFRSRIAVVISAVLATLTLAVAVDGAATAAPTSTPSVATSVAEPVGPTQLLESVAAGNRHEAGWGLAARKIGAFAGCIFGVGVPIGLAWSIATSSAVQGYVLGYASKPLQATVGAKVYNYLDLVKRACRYSLF